MQQPKLTPCNEDHDEWHVHDTEGELYTYKEFAHAMAVFFAFTHVYRMGTMPQNYDGYDPLEELDLIKELEGI